MKRETPSVSSHPLRTALLVLALLAGMNTLGQAETDNRFQIDVLIFANNDASAVMAEQWPEKLYLRYPRNWAKLHWGDSGGSFERVAEADAEFAKAAASVKRSSRYRPLFQASWQQDLVSRKRAPAILIKGGHEYGEHQELEGYLRIAVERYLYVDTNLWFASFNQGNRVSFSSESASSPESSTTRYYLPRQPVSYNDGPELVDEDYESSPEYQQYLKDHPDLAADKPAPESLIANNSVAIDRIVVMKQRRRMRSGELHFIDHPLFGVLVKITKVDRPSAEEPAVILNTTPPAAPSTSADTASQ